MTAPRLRLLLCLTLAPLLLAGCLGKPRVQPQVSLYTLEYPAPVFPAALPVEPALKVEKFSAASDCAVRALVRRPTPFRVESYERCRWAGGVADMVTDLLYRDAAASGLFRRVVSPRQLEATPFILGGEVEEFWEVAAEGGPVAVVELAVSLEDRREQDPVARLLLQRHYRESEAMAAPTPAALAAALSRAMERLSRRLLEELHAAASRPPG
jgi:ABC-type uncharacterized transport system auxiliary subunit